MGTQSKIENILLRKWKKKEFSSDKDFVFLKKIHMRIEE